MNISYSPARVRVERQRMLLAASRKARPSRNPARELAIVTLAVWCALAVALALV